MACIPLDACAAGGRRDWHIIQTSNTEIPKYAPYSQNVFSARQSMRSRTDLSMCLGSRNLEEAG